MKPLRNGQRGFRKEQQMDELPIDSYREMAKMPEPTTCPKCGASYVKGRWTWGKAPAGSFKHKCPACQRIDDNFPAGYVTLKGAFLAAHRDELLNLVKARETRAKEDHALQRIIAVENLADGILVTTTDTHLALGIAEALREAYKGQLDLSFSKAENLLRATWTR